MKLSEKPINARSSWMIDNDGREQEGMTLLEYYAAHAPEVPEWFDGEKEQIPAPPDINDYPENARAEIRSWLRDGTWDLSKDCGSFQEDFNEWRCTRDKILSKNKISRYFQWRIYYAEQIAAEAVLGLSKEIMR